MQEHAKLLVQSVGGSPQEWSSKLSALKKGECYSVGHSLNSATGRLEMVAFRIQVTSLGERFANV
jgi:DNA phosphorothioation-dependent restriction protein DptH